MRHTKQTLSDVTTHLADDQRTTEIEFIMSDGSAHSLSCTAADLSALTTALGAAHARMVNGTAVPSLNGVQVTAVYDPHWLIQYEPLTGGSALLFQHPAFGPVAFIIPRRDQHVVASTLASHANVRMNDAASDLKRIVH